MGSTPVIRGGDKRAEQETSQFELVTMGGVITVVGVVGWAGVAC